MVVLDQPPPPVVTIVDPSRSGPLGEILYVGGPEAPRTLPRPSLVQFIAGSMVLLLAVGTAAAVVRRADRVRADRAAVAALEKAALTPDLSGASNDGSVMLFGYLLSGLSTSSVRSVRLVQGGDGWRIERPLRDLLGGRERPFPVGLARPTSCAQPLTVAPTAVATLQVGRKDRQIALTPPPGFLPYAQALQRLLCGDLPAAQGLVVSAGRSTRSGPHLSFDIGLANQSVRPLQLTRLAVDGLVVTSGAHLPLDVAGRTPGPRSLLSFRRVDEVVGQVVHVELTLRSCRTLGQVLVNSTDQELALDVAVDGEGGPGSQSVPVPGLDQMVRELCPTGLQ